MRNALLLFLGDLVRYNGKTRIKLKGISIDYLAIVAESDINRELYDISASWSMSRNRAIRCKRT